MANKTQAKAAIDTAVVQAKADIDNILPVGVNIKDGTIEFAPIKFFYVLDAGGDLPTAESLLSALEANLTAASRSFVISGSRARRGGDVKLIDAKQILVTTDLAVYRIINF